MEARMSRWALEDLADYVRGVATAATRTAIEADLASAPGSPAASGATAAEVYSLRRDLELLAEVAGVLREEQDPRATGGATAGATTLSPSPDTLAALGAVLTAAARDGKPGLPVLPLLSITDPQAGLAAGFRSAQLGHKDLQVHSDRFDLELSVDTPFDAIDVIVVGRLTKAESESWSVERVPAILVGAGKVLATAVTNRFGEFHVATQSEEDDVELCLLISGVGQIRIPIDRREPLFAESL
jgi:hypothetical protein